MSNPEVAVNGNSISPEQLLWQSVVIANVLDATNEKKHLGKQAYMDRWKADNWIRFNGRDYREVCNLAGIDPDFLRERYMSGEINRAILVAAGSTRRVLEDHL